MPSNNKEWERIGQTEPFYGVLTDKQFLTASRDEQAEEKFWSSGERHIKSVFEFVSAHLTPEFAPEEALDFGCGIGRLLFPMANRCTRVTGVDVSASMLKHAHEQLAAKDLSNISLVHADDGLFSGPEKFDLIHSYIVFQHIPLSRGYLILDQLLGRLKPGGVGILHYTFNNYKRHKWVRRIHGWPLGKQIGNFLRARPLAEPVMQMNEYDLNRIMSRIQPISAGKVHIEFTDHGVLGVILYFKKA